MIRPSANDKTRKMIKTCDEFISIRKKEKRQSSKNVESATSRRHDKPDSQQTRLRQQRTAEFEMRETAKAVEHTRWNENS